ncbi:hypothetical protein HY641_02090 [Candidatus Woesearchaeota archaeon]|nr:hypothetical protein [Candidatus Woesearchaeota archaeon]
MDSINPDITFTNEAGKEIALEIETGSNLKHHPQYLHKKVAKLNETYQDRWYFVLTSNNWLQRYVNTFGHSALLRRHIPSLLKRYFPSHQKLQHNVTTIRHTENIDDKKSENGGVTNEYGGEEGGENLAVS